MATWAFYAFGLLSVWGVVAPMATYYGTQWTTQVEERAACTIRINDAVAAVAREINEAAERVVADAVEAAKVTPPTPTTPTELVALCANDRHCRKVAK